MPNEDKSENIIKKVAQQQRSSDEQQAEENVQLVVFELDKEEYAVQITELQEILRIPDITPIPNAPEFISGIFNLRGKIIVVVDLEKRFNLVRDHEKTAEGNIIFTEVNENSFGIIVDRVTEIINVAQSKIQPTPALVSSKIYSDYLKGVVVLEETGSKKAAKKDMNNEDGGGSRLIILLDLSKMLQEKELLSFGKRVKTIAEGE